MTRDEFEKIINSLFTYFQKAPPKNKAVDLWFQRVNSIPDITAKWIARRIVDNENSLPYNITKAFLGGWGDYKKAHPHLFIKEFEEVECRDCSGSGFLFFKAFDKKLDRMQRYTCRCGACQNWQRSLNSNTRVPRYKLSKLDEKNFEIV